MALLRPAELAGTYYPNSPADCESQLKTWPALPTPGPISNSGLVGAIVPHGGWRYAGRISAGTLKVLQQHQPTPELLVILGGHMDAGAPPRVFIEGSWTTPLGPVSTPVKLAEAVAMGLNAEPETYEEYYDDNAVEVLMPMLRWLWPDIPVLVAGIPPEASPGDVAAELAEQSTAHGFKNCLVIGSADLTHYGPDYRFRPQGMAKTAHPWVLEENDSSLINHLENLDAHAITWEGPRKRNTCSAGAAAASVALAKKWGANKGTSLAHSSSWQEDGCPHEMQSFISYVGLLFEK